MDARTRAVKTHRKRLRTRGLKRVEVTVHEANVSLLREVATRVRSTTGDAKRIKAVLTTRQAQKTKNLADAFYDPVIPGPEFDDAFEEIERSRHYPEMMKTRDIDL